MLTNDDYVDIDLLSSKCDEYKQQHQLNYPENISKINVDSTISSSDTLSSSSQFVYRQALNFKNPGNSDTSRCMMSHMI